MMAERRYVTPGFQPSVAVLQLPFHRFTTLIGCPATALTHSLLRLTS